MPELDFIDQLRHQLVKLGCPAKQVRRLVQEVAEHREDLKQAGVAEGLSAAAAESRANTRLGDPFDLANDLMVTVRRSSWWGRHSFVGFGVLPLLVYPVLWALLVVLQVVLVYGWNMKKLDVAIKNNPVAFHHFIILFQCMDYVAIALATLLFCWLARRSAVNLKWMVIACAVCSVVAVITWGKITGQAFLLGFAVSHGPHRTWILHLQWIRGAVPLLIAGAVYAFQRRVTHGFAGNTAGCRRELAQHSKSRAFTMIELLVVITVIVILAALLLPVLSAAKDRTKRTTCLNNLHQINLGVSMYSDDSNDKAPQASGTTRFINWTGYKKLMKTYVGLNGASSPADKLFACPADIYFYNMNKGSLDYVSASVHAQAFSDYSSYIFNGGNLLQNVFKNPKGGPWPGIAGVKLSSIKQPSKTILVTEYTALFPYSWHSPKPRHSPTPTLSRMPSPTEWPFFNDAKNVVSFVDGHVSYINIYWNTNGSFSGRTWLVPFACTYDPPDNYEYKWSGS
jgi:prepilin-type N-terminal cleavage/methylation domain-containing protein